MSLSRAGCPAGWAPACLLQAAQLPILFCLGFLCPADGPALPLLPGRSYPVGIHRVLDRERSCSEPSASRLCICAWSALAATPRAAHMLTERCICTERLNKYVLCCLNLRSTAACTPAGCEAEVPEQEPESLLPLEIPFMPLQVGLDPSAKRFFTFWFLLFTVHQLAVSLFRSACGSWSSSACSSVHSPLAAGRQLLRVTTDRPHVLQADWCCGTQPGGCKCPCLLHRKWSICCSAAEHHCWAGLPLHSAPRSCAVMCCAAKHCCCTP